MKRRTEDTMETEVSIEHLAKLLERDGKQAEDLDELVHDLKANEAAAINNGGMHSQAEYILECCRSLDDFWAMVGGSMSAKE